MTRVDAGSLNNRTKLCAAAAAAVLIALTSAPGAHATIITGGSVTTPLGPGDTNIPGAVTVGLAAPGNVEVNGGSKLDVGALNIGSDPGGDGFVRVTGAGSQVEMTFAPNSVHLNIGSQGGTGELRIENGGSVINAATTFVATAGVNNTGTISITGNGSQLSLGDFAYVAQSSGSTGTINVSDGGSLSFDHRLLLGGLGGTATINIGDNPNTGVIEGDGVVTGPRLTIGTAAGGTNTVNVSGSSSRLDLLGLDNSGSAAFMFVGGLGTGTLNASDGADIVIDSVSGGPTSGGFILGGSSFNTATTGDGEANLDGAGTTLTQRTGVTFIGNRVGGRLNITNGATADMSLRNVSIVGRFATANGIVNIDGAGSMWDAGNNLVVGANAGLVSGAVTGPGGTGTVTVANGGTLIADTIFLGADATLTGGGGTIFGNVTSEGTVAAGNSPGIMDIHGDLTLTSLGLTEIELGGTNIALGEYDQINLFDNAGTGTVEGNLDIDGAIDVTLFGGFTASAGDFFDVFTALDIDVFAPVWNLPTLASGLDWDIATVALGGSREALRLSVVSTAQVSAPGAITFLLVGAAGLAFVRRRNG